MPDSRRDGESRLADCLGGAFPFGNEHLPLIDGRDDHHSRGYMADSEDPFSRSQSCL